MSSFFKNSCSKVQVPSSTLSVGRLSANKGSSQLLFQFMCALKQNVSTAMQLQWYLVQLVFVQPISWDGKISGLPSAEIGTAPLQMITGRPLTIGHPDRKVLQGFREITREWESLAWWARTQQIKSKIVKAIYCHWIRNGVTWNLQDTHKWVNWGPLKPDLSCPYAAIVGFIKCVSYYKSPEPSKYKSKISFQRLVHLCSHIYQDSMES